MKLRVFKVTTTQDNANSNQTWGTCSLPVTQLVSSLNRLDLEVQRDERKNKTFQVLQKSKQSKVTRETHSQNQWQNWERKKRRDLNKIVKDAKTFRIITALDINERTNLRSSEGDMLISHNDLKLLPSNTVRFRPLKIIFFHYLRKQKRGGVRYNILTKSGAEAPRTHEYDRCKIIHHYKVP